MFVGLHSVARRTAVSPPHCPTTGGGRKSPVNSNRSPSRYDSAPAAAYPSNAFRNKVYSYQGYLNSKLDRHRPPNPLRPEARERSKRRANVVWKSSQIRNLIPANANQCNEQGTAGRIAHGTPAGRRAVTAASPSQTSPAASLMRRLQSPSPSPERTAKARVHFGSTEDLRRSISRRIERHDQDTYIKRLLQDLNANSSKARQLRGYHLEPSLEPENGQGPSSSLFHKQANSNSVVGLNPNRRAGTRARAEIAGERELGRERGLGSAPATGADKADRGPPDATTLGSSSQSDINKPGDTHNIGPRPRRKTDPATNSSNIPGPALARLPGQRDPAQQDDESSKQVPGDRYREDGNDSGRKLKSGKSRSKSKKKSKKEKSDGSPSENRDTLANPPSSQPGTPPAHGAGRENNPTSRDRARGSAGPQLQQSQPVRRASACPPREEASAHSEKDIHDSREQLIIARSNIQHQIERHKYQKNLATVYQRLRSGPEAAVSTDDLYSIWSQKYRGTTGSLPLERHVSASGLGSSFKGGCGGDRTLKGWG